MSGQFAKSTTVSVEKTRAELETLLARYGACAFAYASQEDRAIVGFRIKMGDGVMAVKMTLPLPDKNADVYKRTPERGFRRSADKAREAWEQDCRAHWRALLLVVKAKLEACDIGISTVEREFMPDIVLPNGRTLVEHIGGDVRRMLTTGTQTPLMLPGV